MNRNIKKIAVIISALIVLVGAFLLGKGKTEVATQIIRVETIPEGYIKWDKDNCIDMRTVSDFSATENGLQLYLKDGSGYYWKKE